ncbi:MAG TPA: hypothetical protein VHB20_14605 [Verrucomicrobiae bacterium]|jgi:hypothetical protein|nr:hypothetical protein [Verrucomicrobiae bacterium]
MAPLSAFCDPASPPAAGGDHGWMIAVSISSVLSMLAAVAGLITLWVTQRSSQARFVTLAAEYVERRTFEQHVAQDSAAHLKLEDKISHESGMATAGRQRLHERIDPLQDGVASLTATAEALGRTTATLNASVSDCNTQIGKLVDHLLRKK